MTVPTSRIAGFALVALIAVSCRPQATAPLDQPVEIPVTHAASFGRGELVLLFRRVVADSRCPTGVTCIWAGEGVVAVEARTSRGPVEPFELRLPGGQAADSLFWTTLDAYRIRLVRLEPHPATGTAVDTTRYVGTFLVKRR